MAAGASTRFADRNPPSGNTGGKSPFVGSRLRHLLAVGGKVLRPSRRIGEDRARQVTSSPRQRSADPRPGGKVLSWSGRCLSSSCGVPATLGVNRLCVGEVVGDDVGTAPPVRTRGSGEAESGSGSTTAQGGLALKVASDSPSSKPLARSASIDPARVRRREVLDEWASAPEHWGATRNPRRADGSP